ncbi:MAG: hypothetical protein ACF8MJ_02750 [Phycisphaerales bacterium JB050]
MQVSFLHVVSAARKGDPGQVVLWAILLMAIVVVGGAVVIYIRKKAQQSHREAPALGLSLSDLREMREDGRLTEVEFERAKAMVIGELGGKVERPGGERIKVDGRIVDGELRARAGYDLTGQPLPDFGGVNNPRAESPDDAGGSGRSVES